MSIPIRNLIDLCRDHVKNIDAQVVENEHLLSIDAKPSYDDLLTVGSSIARKVDRCLIELNQQVEQIDLPTLKEEIGRDGRNLFKKLTEIATVHSYRLRAPISRIQGLMNLQEIDPELSSEPEELNEFQKELIKSLTELNQEFELLERLFCEIEIMLED